jgi:hypothetical protein
MIYPTTSVEGRTSNMSERTSNPLDQAQPPLPTIQQESRPPSMPVGVWANLRAEARELKAQNFKSREQVLAWLQARGYEDGETILQRLQAGGEI